MGRNVLKGGAFIVRSNPYNVWVAREAVYFDTAAEAIAECDRLNALQDRNEEELNRLNDEVSDLQQGSDTEEVENV